MRKCSLVVLGLLFICSCEIKGVDTTEGKKVNPTVKKIEATQKKADSLRKIKQTSSDKPLDTIQLKNGIRITYFKHGSGPLLKKGDMIKLDYRSRLMDGTIFDGNNFVKKPYIPFLVGWHQQTKGWDIALEHLRAGDDVDVFIPSKLARGKEGLGKVVPPNSDVKISMHVIEIYKPTFIVDGVRVWRYDQHKKPGDSIQVGDHVLINYWVSSESTPRYDNDYKRGYPTQLVIGDHNIVPGLRKALLYGREGDRLMIVIPANQAYGKKGYLNLVKPNEALFYDIQIAKVTKKADLPS